MSLQRSLFNVQPQLEEMSSLPLSNSIDHNHNQHKPQSLRQTVQFEMLSDKSTPNSRKLTPSAIAELRQKLIEVAPVAPSRIHQSPEGYPTAIALAQYKSVRFSGSISESDMVSSSETQWFQGLPISGSAYDYNGLCHDAIRSIRAHYSQPSKGYYITNIRIIWSYVDEPIGLADFSPRTELKDLLPNEVHESLILMQERKWRDYLVVEFCELEPLIASILGNVSRMEVGVLDRPAVEALIHAGSEDGMEWEGDEMGRDGTVDMENQMGCDLSASLEQSKER